MAKDYLTLGPCPAEEKCAQVGSDNYHHKAMIESRIYIDQLKRLFGDVPEGCSLTTKAFEHDFGTYHEVVVWFDDSDLVGLEYAYALESGLPGQWDDQALTDLANAGMFPVHLES